MLVSLKLLKKFVDLPKDLSAAEIGLKLTMATVEVEEVIDQAQAMNNMVVAEIKEIIDHPNATKLKVCKVNYGATEVAQVVCGASNIYVGMLSILALPGAKVKWHGQGELVTLEPAVLRGVESYGMLCAPEEIGLGRDFQEVDGVIDLKSGKAGVSAAEALGLDDIIIDIDNKSLTNRPDLWGHYGLARELAALYGRKLIPIELQPLTLNKSKKINVEISNPEYCYRYCAVVLDKISAKSSPDWLQKYLITCGLRPINLIVDLTNYVMIELGQPLHAFDADKVDLDSLRVATAKEGDFVCLDGQTRKLDANTLMIADKKNYLAIAGIIGGQQSAISETTTTIVLEAANFSDNNIRKTSNRLGLRTDASIRFEKSLDPELAPLALNRFVSLLQEIDDRVEVVSGIIDQDVKKFKPIEIDLDLEFLAKKLGVELPKKQVLGILTSLGFKVEDKKKFFRILVPSFRATKDISIAEDIVEEVSRIYGYDNIQPVAPIVKLQTLAASAEIELLNEIKKVLVYGAGSTEVYNYSFAPEISMTSLGLKADDHLAIKNAISEDQHYLRLSLLESLYKCAIDNARFYEDINIFEVGRVYSRGNGDWAMDQTNEKFLPQQPVKISGLVYGNKTDSMFFKAKGIVEMLLNKFLVNVQMSLPEKPEPIFIPGHEVRLLVSGQDMGLIAEVATKDNFSNKKSLVYWEIDFSLLQKFCKSIRKYQPTPKYPSITVDLAVVVSEKILWSEIEHLISEISPLVKKVELFDIFRSSNLGQDKKSLAFHIVVQSAERTLRQSEADEVREKVAEMLVKNLAATIR